MLPQDNGKQPTMSSFMANADLHDGQKQRERNRTWKKSVPMRIDLIDSVRLNVARWCLNSPPNTVILSYKEL